MDQHKHVRYSKTATTKSIHEKVLGQTWLQCIGNFFHNFFWLTFLKSFIVSYFQTFCIAVSILLYFFVLALFGWMLCEGIIIYFQLVNVYSGLGLGGKHMRAFFVIGWGKQCMPNDQSESSIPQHTSSLKETQLFSFPIIQWFQ